MRPCRANGRRLGCRRRRRRRARRAVNNKVLSVCQTFRAACVLLRFFFVVRAYITDFCVANLCVYTHKYVHIVGIYYVLFGAEYRHEVTNYLSAANGFLITRKALASKSETD